MKTMATFIALSALVVAALTLLKYQRPVEREEYDSEDTREPPVWEGTAAELSLVYDQNEVYGDGYLGGRMVTVHGEISSVSRMINTYIILHGSPGMSVQLKLDHEYEEVSHLRVGDRVSYDCIVRGLTLNTVFLDECRPTGKSGTVWKEKLH